MKRILAIVVAGLLGLACIGATPTYYGNVSNAHNNQCNLSIGFGAYGDDVHDDSPALNAALAAWEAGKCGTIVLDQNKTYLIDEPIVLPYTLDSTYHNYPYNPRPLRITSDGAAIDGGLGYFAGNVVPSGALDLRYAGTSFGGTVYAAKINTFGFGVLEIDHLTLEDNATDDYPFLETTNTTLRFHDNAVIGDTSESGITSGQDAIFLGNPGNWAGGTTGTVNITSGTKTLTIAGTDPPFTPAMVGYVINFGSTYEWTNSWQGSTIAAYVSPTQVTLSQNATATVTSGYANYFNINAALTAPFEGFTPIISGNYFDHIRRMVIFENYANDSVVADNQISVDSGCNAAIIPNCAPIYFDRSSTVRVGDVLRDNQEEMTNYPFALYVGTRVTGGHFDISTDDASYTTVGGVYQIASSQGNRYGWDSFFAPGNQSVNTSSTSGVSAGAQTVTPLSMTGITTSLPLLIDPDGSGVQEWVTPSVVTGTTFTATFAFAHAGGFRIMSTIPFIAGAGAALNTVIPGQAEGTPQAPFQFPGSINMGTNANTAINVLGSTYFSHPLSSAPGVALTLNTTPGAGQPVDVNYNNAATGGLNVYDGGTTNKAIVSYNSGLQVQGSQYGPYYATVAGPIHAEISVPCTAISMVPCAFTWSCTMTSGACNTTGIVVPSGATCVVSANTSPRISSTDIATYWNTTILTAETVYVQDQLGTATSTFSGVGTCL